MAFNPFDVFRRNQKILFAILTVFIMIMFTLSFGQGDFFTTLPQWIGAKTQKGKTLAYFDGSKFTESDLAQVAQRRQLANAYMNALALRAIANTQQNVRDSLSRVTAEKRPTIEAALQTVNTLGQFTGNFRQSLILQPDLLNFVLQQSRFQQSQAMLQTILLDKSPKATDLDAAQSAQQLLNLALQRVTALAGLYFDTVANFTTRDQLDFALWQRKADRLGIVLTPTDTASLIVEEFNGRVNNKDLAEVELSLRGPGAKPADINAGLVEEFRVRIAQQVVLGQTLTKTGSVGFGAPYDYFQFYKAQTTPARMGIVRFPAEAYLPQVTAKPSESELIKLFNEARNIEPDPSNNRPALREPRRLKLEWFEVKGDEDYYKKQSQATLPQIELQAQLAFAVGLPLGLPTLASTVGAMVPLTERDLTLQAKYKNYKSNFERTVTDNWYGTPFFGSKPLDTDYVKPAQVASVALAFANAALGYSGAFAPATNLAAEATLNNRQARARTIPAATLAPILPGSWAPSILATVAAQSQATLPLPLSAVRPTLVDEAQNDLAKQLAETDLKKFTEDLTKLGEKEDKKEARDLIAKMLKERGFRSGASTEARDIFTIMNDPGLAPLKDKHVEQELLMTQFRPGAGTYVNPVTFGRNFFFDEASQRTGQPKPSEGLYKPQRFPSFAALPSFLVWRTEDVPGETLKDIRNPIVRAKVEALWQRLEARKLAKQAAEAMAKETATLGQSGFEIEMKLKDKVAELAGKFNPLAPRPGYFEMPNVAPLVSELQLFGGPQPPRPFQLAPSTEMPYPTNTMQKNLLDIKDKPYGTSAVLVDRPEDNVYVAVVLDRQEKTIQSFADMAYGKAVESMMVRGSVERAHQQDLRRKAYESALKLIKAELGYDPDKENKELLDKTRDSFDND